MKSRFLGHDITISSKLSLIWISIKQTIQSTSWHGKRRKSNCLLVLEEIVQQWCSWWSSLKQMVFMLYNDGTSKWWAQPSLELFKSLSAIVIAWGRTELETVVQVRFSGSIGFTKVTRAWGKQEWIEAFEDLSRKMSIAKNARRENECVFSMVWLLSRVRKSRKCVFICLFSNG